METSGGNATRNKPRNYGSTTRDDDELNFLLSDVNSQSQQATVKKVQFAENGGTGATISKSEPPYLNPENTAKYWKHTLLYAGMGFVLLCVIMVLTITLGLYVSATGVLIGWILGWLVACCGGFSCLVRKPKALHVFHGTAVALIFGIIAMASFSIFRDIDSRIIYTEVEPDGAETLLPVEGSIIYFKDNTHIDSEIIGSSYQPDCSDVEDTTKCGNLYYCVAPIVDQHFNTSKSNVIFWAGCEVGTENEDCFSTFFKKSECYNSWQARLNSAFVLGGNMAKDFRNSVLDAIKQYDLKSTDLNTTVIVAWVPDPVEEASIFWALGVFSVFGGPVVFGIASALYAVLCRESLQKKEWERSTEI